MSRRRKGHAGSAVLPLSPYKRFSLSPSPPAPLSFATASLTSGFSPATPQLPMAPTGFLPLAMVLLLSILLIFSGQADARTFGFEVHHRYSDHVRRWLSSTAGVSVEDWPERGSVDYYAALFHHDRVFRGRNLAENGPLVTFIDGNMTLHLNALGLYAFVAYNFSSSFSFSFSVHFLRLAFGLVLMVEACTTRPSR